MCRHNLLIGCMSVSFGVGMLIGLWISGDFLCYCLAIGAILLGCGCMHRK